MALVDTQINYFTPPLDGAKPYQWIDSVVEPRRVSHTITTPFLTSHPPYGALELDSRQV